MERLFIQDEKEALQSDRAAVADGKRKYFDNIKRTFKYVNRILEIEYKLIKSH